MYHSVHPKQQGFELFLQRHISSRQVAYADWDAIKKRTFGDTLLSWLFSTQNCSLSLSLSTYCFFCCLHTTQNKILNLLMSKNKDSLLKMEISINISNISAIFASTFIKKIYISKIGSQRGHLVAIKFVITLSKTLQKTTWPFLMQRRFF